MNGYSVLLIWAGLGALVIAWGLSIMPGYPDKDTLPKGAISLALLMLAVISPVIVLYWTLLGIYSAVSWLLRGGAWARRSGR